MTTKELENKVSISRGGHGQYKITIEYRGKEYRCYSNDTLAYDSLTGDWRDNPMTYKQALQSFYNQCKEKNNLR